MSQGDLTEFLRVRVSRGVKDRIEALALKRHIDVSDIVREALFAKYPELKSSEDATGEQAVPSTKDPKIAELLTAQIAAVWGLVDALQPAATPALKAAREKLRKLESEVPDEKATTRKKRVRR